ncbi:ATP-binding cassette domain-containing protein [Mucilaginibacter limnophilus]|uniref:ATP-binding cassette domain-containing protein n=1 Tax=Mucilaginibacter limnophilus TaxID=1932778 RepID=A0A3S2UM82_9SPHI|nr:ATP-binding cassette domain-containing protein [Mucilaginibacter limnophilus]RVT98175.1 ATP-binding cassette domain-containing protein [Mucilaginibacter limnophilus]
MISINITKKLRGHGGQLVLYVTKQFVPGSVTKIYGPSGAGKTTFLKIIAGLITPDEGCITVNGIAWADTNKRINLPAQKRRTGFVFQDYALFPNMTVKQHLQYATNDAKWIAELLMLGKLDNLSDQKPLYLSGGQQQRLAVLRALAIKPDILLMDEPFSALDNRTKTELIAELVEIFKQLNCTVFIVSHNRHELDAFAGEEICIGEE